MNGPVLCPSCDQPCTGCYNGKWGCVRCGRLATQPALPVDPEAE